MKTYVYFISYIGLRDGNLGVTNGTFKTEETITTIEQITGIANKIAVQEGISDVAVLGLYLLRIEEE